MIRAMNFPGGSLARPSTMERSAEASMRSALDRLSGAEPPPAFRPEEKVREAREDEVRTHNRLHLALREATDKIRNLETSLAHANLTIIELRGELDRRPRAIPVSLPSPKPPASLRPRKIRKTQKPVEWWLPKKSTL